jgi:YidC/Oxa1 family membrane protein insertase
MGEEGLQEITYKSALEKKNVTFKNKSGWLGFTDKYWAATLIPNQTADYEAHFTANSANNRDFFQTDYLLNPVTIAPGQTQSIASMVFAGAKQVNVIDSYETKYNIRLFERMIDWGWFYWFTKPLFHMLDFFYRLVGNFGISILIVTVLVKLLFFPLANKSYESMSKMKKLQPEMKRLQERYKDDKMKQQQELMALYKKEKINPMSGCLPILIQIPVFFALYKVLYVTLEMRHAPFFGWIQDLSAPDPTTIFNLFGLIPWDPPHFLMLGVWPIIMGITMFFQMKLNPAPPDPVQAQIFTWMPVLFTFLLASFPAGLVIYWSWNNTLSMLQQYVIMRRQGVEVNLLENIGFTRKNQSSPGKAKS